MSNDDIKLSTGREFSANNGIVGIDADRNISGGYDQGIDTGNPDFDDAEYIWSQADRIALADLMIERWTKFKEQS